MKKSYFLLICTFVSLVLSSCSLNQHQKQDILVQHSAICALRKGVYDGNLTFNALEQYGDFGIGFINSMDGTMIALDGEYYQIKSNSVARRIDPYQKTPFAIVTFFNFESKRKLKKNLSFAQFRQKKNEYMDSSNIFYALKIKGRFKSVRVSCYEKQEKPYPEFRKLIQSRKLYDFNDVKGTIVGFYYPEFANGMNPSGFHLAFINDQKTAGGNVVDFVIDNAVIEIGRASCRERV